MSDDKKLEEKGKEQHWPAFMLIGLSLGGILGILLKNIAIGSGLGLVFGVLVGIFIDNINIFN